jgi:hypothetical protein
MQVGMGLELVPITLREANNFVEQFHRHNKRTARDGGKFAIGVEGEVSDGTRTLVGVAIVGNPLSATYMDGFTAEVLRVCTSPDSPKNTCSMLYGACWRAWRSMGGKKMITYTLKSEPGSSLRGAGWNVVGETKPVKPGWGKRDHLVRAWQPIYGQSKFRWEVATEQETPKCTT